MKTTKLIIAGAMLSFAVTGAAYADNSGFNNKDNGGESSMSAPRPGWNKGSQYSVEWLTRTTNTRSEVSSTSQSPTSPERSAGKNCNLKPMVGFNQHNSFEHSC